MESASDPIERPKVDKYMGGSAIYMCRVYIYIYVHIHTYIHIYIYLNILYM